MPPTPPHIDAGDRPSDQEAAVSVLVVDDEPGVRDLVGRWIKSGGYTVTAASNAEEALACMQRTPSAVALCDIRMPGRDGLWLAERLRHDYPDTAVIMATALDDVAPAIQSLRQGVVDYLTKPFGRDRLREALGRGVEWHRSACNARRWREALSREIQERRARLAATIAGFEIDSDESLDALLSALTAGDRDSYAHAYRVAALSVTMARMLDLSEDDVSTVERGALLHDVGKLVMPEALLRKPAPLTAEERTLIRMHPAIGSALFEGVPFLAAAAGVVRDAHERVDGLGYPQGSRGGAVWIGARIVTVADAFDTMIRSRVFRNALSVADARAEVERCAGTQFDGRVVAVFLRLAALH
jgi:cyclic di-GMP phosphodiesterase